SISTLTRVCCGSRQGYSSLPMYFFASLSICGSAPSSVSSAWPLTATHLYGLLGSTTSSETRGSLLMCRSLARPRAVLKETLPSSVSTQTTVVCGEPSSRSVVAIPTYGFSSRNCFCFWSNAIGSLLGSVQPPPQRDEALASSPMAALLPVATRKGLFLLRGDDARESWDVEGPLLPGWAHYH